MAIKTKKNKTIIQKSWPFLIHPEMHRYQLPTDKLHCAFISGQDTSTKTPKGKGKDIFLS